MIDIRTTNPTKAQLFCRDEELYLLKRRLRQGVGEVIERADASNTEKPDHGPLPGSSRSDKAENPGHWPNYQEEDHPNQCFSPR